MEFLNVHYMPSNSTLAVIMGVPSYSSLELYWQLGSRRNTLTLGNDVYDSPLGFHWHHSSGNGRVTVLLLDWPESWVFHVISTCMTSWWGDAFLSGSVKVYAPQSLQVDLEWDHSIFLWGSVQFSSVAQ